MHRGGTGTTKKIIAFLLAVLILTTTVCAEEPRYTERKSESDEEWLWEELSLYSPSDAVTAGVLAYFWRESQYKSDAVVGWATLMAYEGFDLCGYVVRKADRGLDDGSSRTWFIEAVRGCGGFGLGQWYATHYLRDLYDYARENEMSIGDARMQCGFIFESLKKNSDLWRRLKKCNDPEKAGRLIAIYYDGSQDGAPYMGRVAKKLYKEYGGKQ